MTQLWYSIDENENMFDPNSICFYKHLLETIDSVYTNMNAREYRNVLITHTLITRDCIKIAKYRVL